MEINRKEVEYVCWKIKEFCQKADERINFKKEEDLEEYFLRKTWGLSKEKEKINHVYTTSELHDNSLIFFCSDLRSTNQVYNGDFNTLTSKAGQTVFISILRFNKRILSLTGEVKEKIKKLRQ